MRLPIRSWTIPGFQQPAKTRCGSCFKRQNQPRPTALSAATTLIAPHAGSPWSVLIPPSPANQTISLKLDLQQVKPETLTLPGTPATQALAVHSEGGHWDARSSGSWQKPLGRPKRLKSSCDNWPDLGQGMPLHRLRFWGTMLPRHDPFNAD